MKNNERILVFGSNLRGIHGAGSALEARKNHGAEIGVGVGRTGSSYAIPTKDHDIKTMTLEQISPYITEFLQYAKLRQQYIFDVVKVGCGLAGYSEMQIAPFFAGATDNVVLPEGWRTINGESENPESHDRYMKRGF